jgi:hypothetical protein
VQAEALPKPIDSLHNADVSIEARDLATAFKRAARPGVLETDFRQVVEAYLLELARQSGECGADQRRRHHDVAIPFNLGLKNKMMGRKET